MLRHNKPDVCVDVCVWCFPQFGNVSPFTWLLLLLSVLLFHLVCEAACAHACIREPPAPTNPFNIPLNGLLTVWKCWEHLFHLPCLSDLRPTSYEEAPNCCIILHSQKYSYHSSNELKLRSKNQTINQNIWYEKVKLEKYQWKKRKPRTEVLSEVKWWDYSEHPEQIL